VGQLTLNVVELVPPAGTVTLRDAPALTLQFDARPLRVTVWLPAARPENVTLLFVPIVWLPPPLTVTV
jgi:hypothetical protein